MCTGTAATFSFNGAAAHEPPRPMPKSPPTGSRTASRGRGLMSRRDSHLIMCESREVQLQWGGGSRAAETPDERRGKEHRPRFNGAAAPVPPRRGPSPWGARRRSCFNGAAAHEPPRPLMNCYALTCPAGLQWGGGPRAAETRSSIRGAAGSATSRAAAREPPRLGAMDQLSVGGILQWGRRLSEPPRRSKWTSGCMIP